MRSPYRRRWPHAGDAVGRDTCSVDGVKPAGAGVQPDERMEGAQRGRLKARASAKSVYGGARATATEGRSVGKPRWANRVATSGGKVMKAITRSRPGHSGHWVTSTANTRRRS